MANTIDLYFDVNKAEITRTDDQKVASGALQTIVCNFAFDSTWDGLYRFCRFEGAGGIKDVRIGDESKCVVPWEMIEAPSFTMACYGAQSTDVQLTTLKLHVKVYQSVNFIADEALPADETPALVEQYEKLVTDAVAAQAKNNEEQAANNEEQAANNKRTDDMVTEVTEIVMNDLKPTITSATTATENANAAAKRADEAVADLESGVVPAISTDEIDTMFNN